MFDKILDYIYPPRCISCSTLVQSNEGFCGECWAKLNFITKPYCQICSFEFSVDIGEDNICLKCLESRPNYEACRSLLRFDDNSKKIVHAFKYHDSTFIAQNFAKIMVNLYGSLIQATDCIIPVPMNKWKRLFRLYNPAQVLAVEIAKLINTEVTPNILLKIKHTKSQTGLTKEQRYKNLHGSIEVDSGIMIKGKNILLIDDVMTTGSTLNLCAKRLKAAGAKSVNVLCIAKTLL